MQCSLRSWPAPRYSTCWAGRHSAADAVRALPRPRYRRKTCASPLGRRRVLESLAPHAKSTRQRSLHSLSQSFFPSRSLSSSSIKAPRGTTWSSTKTSFVLDFPVLGSVLLRCSTRFGSTSAFLSPLPFCSFFSRCCSSSEASYTSSKRLCIPMRSTASVNSCSSMLSTTHTPGRSGFRLRNPTHIASPARPALCCDEGSSCNVQRRRKTVVSSRGANCRFRLCFGLVVGSAESGLDFSLTASSTVNSWVRRQRESRAMGRSGWRRRHPATVASRCHRRGAHASSAPSLSDPPWARAPWRSR